LPVSFFWLGFLHRAMNSAGSRRTRGIKEIEECILPGKMV
jgi:hypothetical protein